MGLVIIGIIIFVALIIKCFIDRCIALGIAFMILGIVCSVLIVVITGVIGKVVNESEYDYHNDNEQPIVSLQDNIFIYRRSTDQFVYTYAYKDGDGIRTASVRADNSVIMYDNSETKIITQKGNFKNWWHWLYAFPTREKYKFYVPEGTVKEEYSVDLRG